MRWLSNQEGPSRAGARSWDVGRLSLSSSNRHRADAGTAAQGREPRQAQFHRTPCRTPTLRCKETLSAPLAAFKNVFIMTPPSGPGSIYRCAVLPNMVKVKIDALIDAKAFYALYLEIYPGMQPPGPSL